MSGGHRFATTEAAAETSNFEPTAGLEVKKSGSFLESLFFNMKARDGTRTRGPNLGKVVLYQLSHSRIYLVSISVTDTRHIIHTHTVLVNS